MQKVPFTVGGSGSAYIYGWCDNTWRENMSREDAEAWVARAISLAIARDASSGGGRALGDHPRQGLEQADAGAQAPVAVRIGVAGDPEALGESSESLRAAATGTKKKRKLRFAAARHAHGS